MEAAHNFLRRDAQFDDALGTEEVTELCVRVWQLFPADKYRDRHDENSHVNSAHMMPDLRDGLTGTLVTRATSEALAGLCRLPSTVPLDQRIWVRWRHHEAMKNALSRAWTARVRSSAEILTMTRDRDALTVETPDDLLEAVLASLDRLQHRLRTAESSELRALWNEPKRGERATPKREVMFTDMVADWVRRDLGPNAGVVLNREVQATRVRRLDIKVEATPRHGGAGPITLVIEAKGDWHREVKSSLGKQLVGYLRDNTWTHGIYLVGWFGRRIRKSSRLNHWPPSTISAAREFAADWQRSQCPAGLTVIAWVLDCALPVERSH